MIERWMGQQPVSVWKPSLHFRLCQPSFVPEAIRIAVYRCGSFVLGDIRRVTRADMMFLFSLSFLVTHLDLVPIAMAYGAYIQRSPVRHAYYPSETSYPPPPRPRHAPAAVNPARVLGVFGLSMRTRERDLEDEFHRYGEVEKVVIVYDQRVSDESSSAILVLTFIACRLTDLVVSASSPCEMLTAQSALSKSSTGSCCTVDRSESTFRPLRSRMRRHQANTWAKSVNSVSLYVILSQGAIEFAFRRARPVPFPTPGRSRAAL